MLVGIWGIFRGFCRVGWAFGLIRKNEFVLEKRSNLIIIEKYKNHIISKKVQKFLGLLIRYKYTSSASIDGVINSMPNIRDSC